MKRHEGWPSILAAYIEGARKRPFSFGEHDCLLFAAGAALAMTGTDPVSHLRGTYHDERTALEVIHRSGGMQALGVSCFGYPIAPRLAQRGDVCLVNTGHRESLAVCEGCRLWAPGSEQLLCLPMTEAMCAWRV